MPPINRMETNTTTSDRFIDSRVNPTSFAPSKAACIGLWPRRICRAMFSSTTIASSTTSPVAIISAINDRLLREKPSRYITEKLPISDTGTAKAGITAARQCPRNSNTTTITRAVAISSERSASCSVAVITDERSIATCNWAEAGNTACNPGSSALMSLMVAIMLAFACRLITSNTALWSLKKPLL